MKKQKQTPHTNGFTNLLALCSTFVLPPTHPFLILVLLFYEIMNF